MNSTENYAGDIEPLEAWNILKEDAKSVLVDCRTDAEFVFVGLCDLTTLGKQPATIPWKNFPDMDLNLDFINQVKSAQPDSSSPVLFICRSGQRSRDAAIALTAAGFSKCYNIAGGFAGDCDQAKHRGTVNGWKCADLPWVQK